MFDDHELNQVIQQLSPIKVFEHRKSAQIEFQSAPKPQTQTRDTVAKRRIKRDALWKPLLRKFRQWVRSLMQTNSTEGEIQMDIGCHYWSFKRMIAKVQDLMLFYNMPELILRDDKYLHQMILLLFPTMATKTAHQKRWDPAFATRLPEIKQLFWCIFKENNIEMRKKFFQEPLV